MSRRENVPSVCTGSMGNARKVMLVSTFMFTKKRRFLPVNTSHKKAYVRRVTSVFTDMSSATV